MQVADVVRVPSRPRLADVIALGKPRLSMLVVCTAAAGIWLSPLPMVWWKAILTLLATTVLVGCANAMNSYFERRTDAQMKRTRRRPLPAQLIDPQAAMISALVLAGVSVATLVWVANPVTAVLGFVAFATYAFIYTPMKQHSALALFVGGVPGAIPPLMGWTAATGRLDEVGIALFGILFFWQLPHFIAISIYLGDDYERGGIKVFSNVYGATLTKLSILLSTFALAGVSLSLVPLGVVSSFYGWGAALLGLGFTAWTLIGIRRMKLKAWGRRVFLGSLAYLTLLLAVLAVGAH
ncbi:MAG: heme o synthase [Myxococcota bacterium]